jgi:hypothetical protein
LDAWEKPNILMFFERKGRCGATIYETMQHNEDAKHRKSNSSIFGMYIQEMSEKIADTWRISFEVVKEHEGIEKFKESIHNTWIQARKHGSDELLHNNRRSLVSTRRMARAMDGASSRKERIKG